MGFASGFTLPIDAARVLLSTRRLWKWALAPLAVNALLYAGVVALGVWLVDRWQVQMGWSFWGGFGEWLAVMVNRSFGAMKWVIAMPIIFFACYFSFTTVGMIVASPVNDVLSDRAERVIRGERFVESTAGSGEAIRAMMASVIDSAAIVLRQVLWSIVALPFLLVPVVGALPLLLVSAHFTGRGFIDVAAARHRLRPLHTRAVLRQRRGQVLGLGAAMLVLFMIPFAGLLMLPLGVIAGSILFCRIDWPMEMAAAGVEPPRVVPRRIP